MTEAQFLSISDGQWEHNHVGYMLGVTLREGGSRVYLNGLKEELEEEGEGEGGEVRLSGALAERAMYARLMHDGGSGGVEYLSGVWVRANDVVVRVQALLSGTPGNQRVCDVAGPRLAVSNHVAQLAADYAALELSGSLLSGAGQSSAVIASWLVRPGDERDALMPPALWRAIVTSLSRENPSSSASGGLSGTADIPGSVSGGLSGNTPRDTLKYTPGATTGSAPQVTPVIVSKTQGSTLGLTSEAGDTPAPLKDTLAPLIRAVAASALQASPAKDYSAVLRALDWLVALPAVAACIPLLPTFDPPATTPKTIEIFSFLGPFFARLGIFPDADPSTAETFFASPSPFIEVNSSGAAADGIGIGARNHSDVCATIDSFRATAASISSSLSESTMAMVRASPFARDRILAYFAHIAALNAPRAKMHLDRTTFGSDNYIFNAITVLLRMCAPIVDVKYSKLHLIDPNYLLYSTRLSAVIDKDTTRLVCDADAVVAYTALWQAENPDWQSRDPGFVTELYWITSVIMHLGPTSIIRSFNATVKDLEEMKRTMDQMRAEKDSGAWNGPMGAVNEQLYKRIQVQFDKLVSHKLAYEAMLLDPYMLEQIIKFYHLTCMFLIRTLLISTSALVPSPAKKSDQIHWDALARGLSTPPHQPSHISLFTPLNPPTPLWSTLPEWFLEDLTEIYLFTLRHAPTLFLNTLPRDELLTLAMLLLHHPHLVRNPYLKSKFVEILYLFTVPLWRSSDGNLGPTLDQVFTTHHLAREYLIEGLMRFYIDVEQTGLRSQFYDKFNIRYHISQIFKNVWNDPWYRNKVIAESRNSEQFIRFANLLNNDVTYLLDESLSKLAEINAIQAEMATPGFSSQPAQYKKEKDTQMAQAERQASGYMSLGNETVHMLQYMTADPKIISPFMAPEVVDRLAAMLDYNLNTLVGPKSTDLKVKNPEKYRFNPRVLLTMIIDVYLNLSHRREFVEAVAKDTRSYRKEIFVKACGILTRNNLKSADETSNLMAFVQNVELYTQQVQSEEQDLGDIPDDFLDPLMYTLMDDPVILPSSHTTVDRSTIKAHLLSDTHDPFNRVPLKIEDVVPDTDMKRRIDEWRASKLRK